MSRYTKIFYIQGSLKCLKALKRYMLILKNAVIM